MRLLRFLAGLAAAGLLAAVVLGYGAPLYFELDLLAHFRLHLLGLSGAMALAALVLRAPAALWRALAAAVLAAAGLGPLWAGPGPAGTGTPVTVMTANIYFHNPVPGEMRRALIAADADILVTVETAGDSVAGADGIAGPEGVAEPEGLDSVYPHRAQVEPTNRAWRTVIWSRFPIRRQAPALLDEVGNPSAMQAVVEIAPGRTLSVVGVHLQHVSLGNQGRQVESLGVETAGLPRPMVVMGDFNATAWSWAIHRAEVLTGTRRVGGVIRTWDGDYPTPLGPFPEPFGLPIDHILVSEGIGVEEIGTVDIPGSDHDAVRAVLRVPE